MKLVCEVQKYDFELREYTSIPVGRQRTSFKAKELIIAQEDKFQTLEYRRACHRIYRKLKTSIPYKRSKKRKVHGLFLSFNVLSGIEQAAPNDINCVYQNPKGLAPAHKNARRSKKKSIYNPINQREIRLWHRKDSYVNQVMTPYDNVISGVTAGIKVPVDITREDLTVVMNTNSKSVPTRNICGGTTCVFNLVQIANPYQ